MKNEAIYPGTFDPITNGHLDIIKRSLKLFDKVIVAVASSDSKQPMFSIEQRIEMIQDSTKDLNNIEVVFFDSLLVTFAKSKGIINIVRGLRVVSDFEYELQMGYANSSLDPNIETIYLMPSLENAFISSSIVRAIIKHKGNVSHLVSNNILDKLH